MAFHTIKDLTNPTLLDLKISCSFVFAYKKSYDFLTRQKTPDLYFSSFENV